MCKFYQGKVPLSNQQNPDEKAWIAPISCLISPGRRASKKTFNSSHSKFRPVFQTTDQFSPGLSPKYEPNTQKCVFHSCTSRSLDSSRVDYELSRNPFASTLRQKISTWLARTRFSPLTLFYEPEKQYLSKRGPKGQNVPKPRGLGQIGSLL